MGFNAGFALVVKHSGGADKFGNPLTPLPDTTVEGCAAAPAGSTELLNGQTTVLDQDTIYAPYGAAVTAEDQVVVPAGQAIAAGTYDVDGTPAQWRSPYTGRGFGCVIRLTRATG